MKIYRMRHKETGLFSTSGLLYQRGTYGRSKYGKIWKTLAHVKSAINCHYGCESSDYLTVIRNEGYELIEYDLDVSAGKVISE